MKKLAVAILIVLLGYGLWSGIGAFLQRSDTVAKTELPDDGAVTEEAVLEREPGKSTVGILDPAYEPSEATKLLEQHLKSLGFQVTVVTAEAQSDERAQEETTLRINSGSEDALATVRRLVLVPTVIRTAPAEGQEADVVFSAWNVSDIAWSEEESIDAGRLSSPNPGTIPVLVLNAGAESGTGGRIADLLKQKGFTLATAENSDTESLEEALVYYRRNFRTTARLIVQELISTGYSEASYRYRDNQEQPVVVVLGTSSATSTPAE